MYNSVVFSTFTMLCNHHHYLGLFITPNKNFIHTEQLSLPIPPSHSAPGNHNLLCASMDLPILDISYEWNQMISDILCLANTLHNVFKVHSYCMYQYFLPFYGWTIFHHMNIPQFVDPFIHQQALGLFLLLGTVNSVVEKFCVQVFFLNMRFQFFCGICLEVKLLDHMVILCLTFWRTTKLFSTDAETF